MKLLFLLAVLIPAVSSARIGMTRAECNEKYGESIGKHQDAAVYGAKQFLVAVTFNDDQRAVRIDYVCYKDDKMKMALLAMKKGLLLEANREIPPETIQVILKANRAETWRKSEGGWVTEDGVHAARYDSEEKILIVIHRKEYELHQDLPDTDGL